MRFPLLLVYETDGRLAARLQDLAKSQKWILRQTRRPEECLSLLAQGGACVLVLKLSSDRAAELAMLDRITWQSPQASVIVLAEDALAGLAWDLGASYVMLPSDDRDRLPELVSGLMGTPRGGRGDA
jgi:hypothetical protein